MAASPLISVVIPCYNHGHFVGEAVASAGRRSPDDVEIIVVDDGSTDETERIVRAFPDVTCIRQEHAGLSCARNRGLVEARGRYIVFLDADDRLAPGALDAGVSALAAHTYAAFVFGRCTMMSADGTLLPTPAQPRIASDHYLELLKRNCIWMPGTVMFRREPVEAAGGFDPAVDAAADYALYLRITRTQPVFDHGRVVAHYRQHDTNMSRNASRMLRESLEVLRREGRFVRGNPALQAAYDAGIEGWKEFYGTHLVNEVRAHVHAREWASASRKIAVLGRLHPRGLIHHGWRKASIAMRLRRGLTS